MIGSTQITNTDIFTFKALLVFKLFSRSKQKKTIETVKK